MRTARLLAALLLALLALTGTASPAWAHAALLHTDPHDGAVLEYEPRQVVLTFSEPVGTALGALRVVGPDGERVDTGRTTAREGRTEVVAPLRPDLAEGTYVLLWRVMSEDGHPVTGASTFSVGRESTPGTTADADPPPGAAGRLLAASRGVLFAGLVVLVGGAALVLALWPAGAGLRRVRRVLWAGWAATALGSLAALLAQGPYVAGLPLARGPGLLDEVLGTGFGTATAARLALLLPAAVLLLALPTARRRTAALVGVPVGGGLLLATSLAGHAAAAGPLALTVDVVHVGGVAAWLGGLVVLLLGVLRRPDAARLAAVLPRWSRWATGSVLLIVGTGALASWREVGGPGALVGTTYGRLLLVKLALVAGMLLLAALGRSAVRRRWSAVVVHASTTAPVDARPGTAPDPGRPDVARLRRTVALEAGTGALVLAVTAALVGTTPARVAYAPPFSGTAEVAAPLQLQVDLEPARAGLNQLHVYYTAAGGLAVDVEEVTARLTSSTGEVVPVTVPRDTLGHYEQLTVPLPEAGDWQLQITTRTSDVDSTTTGFRVRVR